MWATLDICRAFQANGRDAITHTREQVAQGGMCCGGVTQVEFVTFGSLIFSWHSIRMHSTSQVWVVDGDAKGRKHCSREMFITP